MSKSFNFKEGNTRLYVVHKEALNGNGMEKKIKKDKFDNFISKLEQKGFIINKEGDEQIIVAQFGPDGQLLDPFPEKYNAKYGWYTNRTKKIPHFVKNIARFKIEPIERNWGTGKEINVDFIIENLVPEDSNLTYLVRIIERMITDDIGASFIPVNATNNNNKNVAVDMNVNKNAVPEKNVEMSGQENAKPKENVKPNENDFNMLGGTKKRSKSKSKRRHTKKHRKTRRRA